MNDFLSNFEKANKNAKRLSNKILIGGKLVLPSTNNKINVINPSTGEDIGEAPQCNKVEVNLAVGDKCGRCWKILPEVITNDGICKRCEEVVTAMV